MNNLENDVSNLLEEIKLYNVKPNKSLSGRIRKQLGELKKNVASIRAKLVEADKAGY